MVSFGRDLIHFYLHPSSFPYFCNPFIVLLFALQGSFDNARKSFLNIQIFAGFFGYKFQRYSAQVLERQNFPPPPSSRSFFFFGVKFRKTNRKVSFIFSQYDLFRAFIELKPPEPGGEGGGLGICSLAH